METLGIFRRKENANKFIFVIATFGNEESMKEAFLEIFFAQFLPTAG